MFLKPLASPLHEEKDIRAIVEDEAWIGNSARGPRYACYYGDEIYYGLDEDELVENICRAERIPFGGGA